MYKLFNLVTTNTTDNNNTDTTINTNNNTDSLFGVETKYDNYTKK